VNTKSRRIHPMPNELRKWNEDVTKFARMHGWRVSSNPGAHNGFPQLVMVRSLPSGDSRILFVRLLESEERLSGSQREWLFGIKNVSRMCHPHVAAYAWKPEDWPETQKVLS
jgi:hypothetical protein